MLQEPPRHSDRPRLDGPRPSAAGGQLEGSATAILLAGLSARRRGRHFRGATHARLDRSVEPDLRRKHGQNVVRASLAPDGCSPVARSVYQQQHARRLVAAPLPAIAAPVSGPLAPRASSRSPMSKRASSTSRWSSSDHMTTPAGARPTTRACATSARTSRTRTSPMSRTSSKRRLRADLPKPGAQGLRLHHRHLVRLHGPDGARWPRSSRTPPSCT